MVIELKPGDHEEDERLEEEVEGAELDEVELVDEVDALEGLRATVG